MTTRPLLMDKLLNFLLRSGSFFLFALLEAICFFLIVNFNSDQAAIWAKTSSVYFGSYNEWMAERRAYWDLDEANNVLRRENARLRGLLPSAAYNTEAEVDSLTDDARLQRFNYLAARMINKSPYGPNNTLIIDRGSDFQVRRGQGVVAGEGLVGIVSDVTARYARVLSVLHLSTRISAGLSNNAYGTLRWDGRDPRFMTVTDIPDYVEVSETDTVFTTGYSNVFPTGLPIGTVAGSEVQPGTGSQHLRVRLLGEPLLVTSGYVVQDLFKEELDFLNYGE